MKMLLDIATHIGTHNTVNGKANGRTMTVMPDSSGMIRIERSVPMAKKTRYMIIFRAGDYITSSIRIAGDSFRIDDGWVEVVRNFLTVAAFPASAILGIVELSDEADEQ